MTREIKFVTYLEQQKLIKFILNVKAGMQSVQVFSDFTSNPTFAEAP
jgi:hypothetical protein